MICIPPAVDPEPCFGNTKLETRLILVLSDDDDDDDMFTPEKHLPAPGQRGHIPKRHTAAGTADPTTTDTGNTVPQRANPTQTAYARSRKRAQAQGQTERGPRPLLTKSLTTRRHLMTSG